MIRQKRDHVSRGRPPPCRLPRHPSAAKRLSLTPLPPGSRTTKPGQAAGTRQRHEEGGTRKPPALPCWALQRKQHGKPEHLEPTVLTEREGHGGHRSALGSHTSGGN